MILLCDTYQSRLTARISIAKIYEDSVEYEKIFKIIDKASVAEQKVFNYSNFILTAINTLLIDNGGYS